MSVPRRTAKMSTSGLRRRRWSRLLVAGASASIATTALMAPTPGTAEVATRSEPTADTYVKYWDDIGSQAFTAAALGPPEGHVLFGYAGIAMYDAVMAVRRDHEPFAIRTHAPRGASAEAAVTAAAFRIWAHYLPAQEATILKPAYDASLAPIPDGQAEDDGVALGERVAQALIALRADDGFREPVTYTPPNPPIPGVWLPTAPPPAQPAGVYLGGMLPFALESTDQFRPDGPPELTSRRWARDYKEVKKVGSASDPSTVRTADQTTAARFWAELPVQQAHGALRGVIDQHHLNISQAARMMAMVSVAYADGIIGCFEAKYHYAFWRPITAIRAGDTDGNAATIADPTWTPLLPATPNHPDYPSAHSCITPAGGDALAAFLGTRRIDLTIPSLTGLGDRHFNTVRALSTEVGNARIWGGIHFRTAVEDGIKMAHRTAREVLKDNFQRTRH